MPNSSQEAIQRMEQNRTLVNDSDMREGGRNIKRERERESKEGKRERIEKGRESKESKRERIEKARENRESERE